MGNAAKAYTTKKSKSNKKRLKMRNGGGEAFLVKDIESAELRAFLSDVMALGVAVMFVNAKYGDAFGIRIYHDDIEVETMWIKSEEELGLIFEGVQGALFD